MVPNGSKMGKYARSVRILVHLRRNEKVETFKFFI